MARQSVRARLRQHGTPALRRAQRRAPREGIRHDRRQRPHDGLAQHLGARRLLPRRQGRTGPRARAPALSRRRRRPAPPSGDLPAATAKLVSDKSTYEAGEFARLDIVSPFEGLALVTLEADRVLVSKWVKVSAGTNAAQMEVPEGYSAARLPERLSLVRSSKDAARFLKAYARATAPVTLNMKPRTLGVKLEAPAVVPDTRELKVTVKSDAPGRVFLWAVDTGILSLTGYRTPSPRSCASRRPRTSGRHAPDARGLMPKRMSFRARRPLRRRLSARGPFRPPTRWPILSGARWIARPSGWAGSLETNEKGRTVTVSPHPNSTAAWRLMAVGASEGRVGGASIDTAVRALHPDADPAGVRRTWRRLHGRRLPQRRGALEGIRGARPARRTERRRALRASRPGGAGRSHRTLLTLPQAQCRAPHPSP